MFLITALLFICSLLAFTISAVCGGGASFVLIPLLGIALPATQVPAALSIGTTASSLSRIAVLWSNIRWELVKWFIPAAIPAVALGAWLLTYVNPLYLEFLLGAYLLFNLPFIFKKEPGGQVIKKQKDQVIKWENGLIISVIGCLTGFLSGLTGAVGLIFNRFYLSYGLSKEQIVATRAANELILHLIKIGLYASFGLIVAETLIYGLVLSLAAIVSSFGLKYLLPLISEKIFQKIGYSAMVLSGIFLFTTASSKIMNTNKVQFDYRPLSGGLETKLNWKQYNFALEFEYDEGFEFEKMIDIDALPEAKRQRVNSLVKGADRFVLEEVFGFRKHYYELYLWKDGRFSKFDIR